LLRGKGACVGGQWGTIYIFPVKKKMLFCSGLVTLLAQYAKMLAFRQSIEKMGMATAEIARTLGVSMITISRAITRGARLKQSSDNFA